MLVAPSIPTPDFGKLSSAKVFNEWIVPTANRILPQQDDTEEILASQRPVSRNSSLPQGLDQPPQQYASPTDPRAIYAPQSATTAPQQIQQTVPTTLQEPLGARAPGDPTAANLTSFVKRFEGFNPDAYDDYGQTSIGYGTRARPGERSISPLIAEQRLEEELGTHRQRVQALNLSAGYEFSDNQIDALTSFDYNTGSLEQLTDNGTRDIATIGQKINLYNKAGGKELRGLTRRRQAESLLFTRGY